MLQAVQFLQSRPKATARVGIWGVDVGAFAALKTAAACVEVRAIVADGAFESIADFIGYRIAEDFGWKTVSCNLAASRYSGWFTFGTVLSRTNNSLCRRFPIERSFSSRAKIGGIWDI